MQKSFTGATGVYGMFVDSNIISDVTSFAVGFGSALTTQAASFTLPNVYHFFANNVIAGAGSTVTNQYGFFANSVMTGATNNYGFYGNIPASTNRWNLYMNGTAANYLAGSLGIGTTSISAKLHVSGGDSVFGSGNLTRILGASQIIDFTNAAQSVYVDGRINGLTLKFYTNTGNGIDISNTGSVGIGTTSLTGYSLRVAANIVGATTSNAQENAGVVQSSVTAAARYFNAYGSVQNTAFTLTNLFLYRADASPSFGSATVTNQTGYYVESTLTGATNNYGFYGNIALGTGRWNLYMSGTANNYMAGSLGIGSTSLTGRTLYLGKTITGATNSTGLYQDGIIQSDVTASARYFDTYAQIQNTAFTLTNLFHYRAGSNTFGSAIVTNQYGFIADASITGATNNYGFFGNIASGTNRWNLYMAGTAANYMAGNLLLSKTTTGFATVGLLYESAAALEITTNGARALRLNRLTSDGEILTISQASTLVGTIGSSSGGIYIGTGTSGTARLNVKSTGQMRFVPLASDPSGAEAGDIYYNSTTNALKLYDGTVWRTITVI
jgi:hypothetical protein